MDSYITGIILIVLGSIYGILKGILNIGNNFARPKRLIDKVGLTNARIIYFISGIIVIIFGVILIVNPALIGR